jgi:SpoVK/Ycf46/Vps4 family AAA+-type ATPase
VSQPWDWRRNYRVWEANRRAFVYPENWTEPERRLPRGVDEDLRKVVVAAGTGRASVLFTGTTRMGMFVAGARLARDLGLDLYRVDLTRVVGKYVGETEKNLGRVFDAVEEQRVVLWFDEADALLGKRSEIKDSHDRYANAELSYLLQRIEEHAGLAILATNKKRLSMAFQRRFDFVIPAARARPSAPRRDRSRPRARR